MASKPPDLAYKQRLDALLSAQLEIAQQHFHRRLIVFQGRDLWCSEHIQYVLSWYETNLVNAEKELLLFSNNLDIRPRPVINPKHYKTLLGTECNIVIWDGHSNLDANGICASAGLLRGGGLYIFSCPSDIADKAAKGIHKHSSDDAYACILKQSFVVSQDILLLKEDAKLPSCPKEPEGNIGRRDSSEIPNAGQQNVIEKISRKLLGHRNRPLIIEADRGRGKSTALALSAIELVKSHKPQDPLILTAPSKQNCLTFFKYIEQRLSTDEQSQILFRSPDELILSPQKCSILFIDEAAAIPAPQLEQLVQTYPRVVLASTVQGYEGSGRGFQIRFKSKLNQLCPGWSELKLEEPVRWAKHDPLELWCFDTFSLNANINNDLKIVSNKIEQQSDNTDSIQARWYDRNLLTGDSKIRRNVFGLLALAHYQTSPSDYQFILQHPKLRMVVITSTSYGNTDNVMGIAIILEEGNLTDAKLNEEIVLGARRPAGNLVPQALAVHACNSDILTTKSWRIMRIVVHPELNRKGIGTKLTEFVRSEAESQNVDFLSASFALQEEVLNFWSKNAFQLSWLGYHKDKSSGAHSAIVTQTLSESAIPVLAKVSELFSEQFVHLLASTFKSLPHLEAFQILELISQNSDRNPQQNDLLAAIVNHFAYGHRSLEDSAKQLVEYYLACAKAGKISRLSIEQNGITIKKLLQHQDWSQISEANLISGKKQGLFYLRQIFQILLTDASDNTASDS